MLEEINQVLPRKQFLFYGFVFALAFTLGWLGIPTMVSVIDKVTAMTGGVFSALIIICSILIFPLWIWIILRGHFLSALGLQILLLNISSRAADLFGIVAYTLEDGFEQKISLTTFSIFFFFFYLLLIRLPMRRPERYFKTFEFLLWIFALLTTISQFVNHTFFSAFWLSIGGVWQYVALFYIVSAVVQKQIDIRYLLKWIVWGILFSIAIRIGVRGETFFVVEPGGFKRLGSVSFGSYVYYAGYVTFIIILTFYLLHTAKKRWAQVGWIVVLGILFLELLNTFTRGGILAVLFLTLLPLWKRQRMLFAKIMISGLLLFLFAGQKLLELITLRGLPLGADLLELQGVATRLWLYKVYIPHFFDRLGMGYGIGKSLYFSNLAYYLGRELPVHGMILEISEMAGGIAALVMIGIYGFVCVQLCEVSRKKSDSLGTTATFLLVALLSWFFFANATGVSILFYTPYEATILMYIILFMSAILRSMVNKARSSSLRG